MNYTKRSIWIINFLSVPMQCYSLKLMLHSFKHLMTSSVTVFRPILLPIKWSRKKFF